MRDTVPAVLATQISATELIAIAAAALAVIAVIAAAALAVSLRRLRIAQRRVLGEHGDHDLIAHAGRASKSRHSAILRDYTEEVAERLDARLGEAERRIDGAITHHALMRYDAYHEMSGQQSLSIALLDAHSSGIVLSSIHHRRPGPAVRQAGSTAARRS